MSKIPIAGEFLPKNDSGKYSRNEIEKAMVKFTKLHVEAQRNSIIKNISLIENMRTDRNKMDDPFNKESDFYIDKNSILNAYPLNNIK